MLRRMSDRVLDIGIYLLHNALILFNLFGWAWAKTRVANLVTLLLTGASWTLLGIWYGIGYCPITDWHWQIKRRLGQTDLPHSYIKYLIDTPTGLDISPAFADILAGSAFAVALALSIGLNLRDWRRPA